MLSHRRDFKRPAVGLLLVALLSGCSGIKPYPNTAAKNLHIRTETESGSFFSNVRAAVSIYRVDGQCQIGYEGTVDLDDSPIAVGIPAGKPSYLVFAFTSSSFLANSTSTTRYETLLEPVPGRDYDIRVSYMDDIYNVEIRESQSGRSLNRNVRRKDLSTCKNA